MQAVRETLGDVVYGVDTDSLENTVKILLEDRGMTLAAAESCTGGLLSKRMTDMPGASRVFLGGVVAYGKEAKTEFLGIPPEFMQDNGAVSREVALAMADGVRKRLGSDIGIGITGIAGPGGGGSGLEVGTAFVALTTKDRSFCKQPRMFHDRDRIRMSSASHALDMLRRFLTDLPVV
jgi:nicotinamide-nucleotide amidase